MVKFAVTDATARNENGERYTLGIASTEAGARRVLARWLKRPVRKARLITLGPVGAFRRQWIEDGIRG
jgi:hypothetical protein